MREKEDNRRKVMWKHTLASLNPDWSEQLSERAIQQRKDWLSFDEQDEELVREVDAIIEENIDPMMDDMYSHFLSFDETQKFFPDTQTLKRAQEAQKAYFLRICKGNYKSAYVAERLTVGHTHYRIGLDPTWYIGAYNRVMTWLRALLYERYSHNPEKFQRILSAINRLIFFDMGLAIESYSIAKEQAIRAHRDEIAELETERRVTKGMLEGAPSAIVRLDSEFICMECNEEFLTLIGSLDRNSVIGQYLFAVAPGLPANLFREVAESGQPLSHTASALSFTAVPLHVTKFFDWSVWPIKGVQGETRGLVATFTDVTASVLLQQQREDFVATLTHDLKTPILAANRAIKLLIEGDFGHVADTQKQVLETILESNSSMYKMVQTLLDVYRYDSGAKQLRFATVDLAKTIKSMIKELEPLANQRGLLLSYSLESDPFDVVCDIEELRRVIQNLLDNALKFTPNGGNIEVITKRRDRSVKIAIRDTGKGISESDKPKLFQRFWAAAGSGRYYASTGLGLYLCRKIVELHGGHIWCESEVSKGSTFYFTIDTDTAVAPQS